ncbi:endonuclease/exonuclease/phosphatase [Actinophytocola xanthii]|uniref:Endonuclease/exonuclease/phosphatase n=1 Tax=Actinophytocola xanthii TaxID=1912961 RepID=A0A1Q8CM76_9PSEU|nr:endonuclease/exonuclease/phosphatase [Actinophytocola xanthii]
MRVLTLNIQHDAGDQRRLPLLNRELRRLRPHLVALQEVREHQLPVLLAGTDLRHTTHQSALIRTTDVGGSVVATRWPHRVVDSMERRENNAHWWLLAVTVTVPARGDLLFVTGSTPWEPSAEWAREHQARELVALIARHPTPLPPVVAGDLNAAPDSASIRHLTAHLRDAWATAGQGAGHTWTVDNPLAAAEIARLIGDPTHRRRIDYVLAGREARVRSATLVANHPVDGVWLSDHFGVLADLDLTGVRH